MDSDFSGTLAAVMMRKSQLLYALLDEAAKRKGRLSKQDEKLIDSYVLRMPSRFFLVDIEKEKKKVNYDLKLKDLSIDIKKILKDAGI